MSKFNVGQIVFLFNGVDSATKISLLKITKVTTIESANERKYEYIAETESGLNIKFKDNHNGSIMNTRDAINALRRLSNEAEIVAY